MKKVMTLSIVLLGAVAICINAHAADERPNIIFLLSDDQAWTDYGFMGHPDIQMPHLDKLSKEGLLFRRGYLAAPVRLYNLKDDPREENELSAQYPEVVSRLRAKIGAWHPVQR